MLAHARSVYNRAMRRSLAVLGLLAWLACPPPVEAGGVREADVEYTGSEGAMPARLYIPEGVGRRPGVLVLHGTDGPQPAIEAFARNLAVEGFVTLTPDLFSLHEFGSEGRVDHPLVLGDLAGALAFLKQLPEVDPARIGAIGFSFGGRLAVLAAVVHPEIRAAVDYYGVASFQALTSRREIGGRALASTPLTERLSLLRAAVLIHHGEADQTVPVEQGRLLQAALRRAGKRSQLYIYPGADHVFNFPGSRNYAEAARLSWGRTLAFFRENLR